MVVWQFNDGSILGFILSSSAISKHFFYLHKDSSVLCPPSHLQGKGSEEEEGTVRTLLFHLSSLDRIYFHGPIQLQGTLRNVNISCVSMCPAKVW